MNTTAVRLAAFLLLCSLSSFAQRKASPSAPKKAPAKSIRFEGAPQYAQDELLTATGLKPDARLTPVAVKAAAKQLNDTGLFAMVRFTTDARGLLFTLTPAAQLFPIHLDNLPLTPGTALDGQLHARLPLYHGQSPASGSLVEGIRQALEQMLAAQGIKASVKAGLTSGLGPQKITAVDFTIAAPPVRIGPIQYSGVSAAMQPKVDALAAGQTGNGFDTENSGPGLKHAFEDLYQDQGYAAVEVAVTQIAPPLVGDQAIAIPFSVAVKEGGVYALGAITYPPDALVARADVQKVLAKYPAGSGRPLDLFLLAVRDAYHARGYLDCAVAAHAAFNEATHIVNYSVEVAPGSLYQMGAVQFDGAPDAMAQRLTRQWTLAPGQTFDESYVSGFEALARKKDKTLSKWLQSVVTTDDIKPDADTHQVTVLFHFSKAAPSGR